ncbi:MAG: hypothetical protein HY319_00370 [Armatimonadetes bacterium]|nr:hypothetical protein [Armatimonadota bacterium]
MEFDLKHWLEAQGLLWLLVREDGSAMLAAPMRFPPERFLFPSEQPERAPRTITECLEVARQALLAPDGAIQGLIVSIPRSLGRASAMGLTLRGEGAAPLERWQEEALAETGMVPFGEWSDPNWAALYLLTSAREREGVSPGKS